MNAQTRMLPPNVPQVDPRVSPAKASAAIRAAAAMALRSSQPSLLDPAAISAVLAEAYEAVTRGRILVAEE